MNEEKCWKEDVINDIKDRLEKLEINDREDYGARKELALSIKLFAESQKEQSQAIIDIGKTLVKVNENLDSLNKEHREIKRDVNDLKEKVNENEKKEFKRHLFDFTPLKEKMLYIFFILGFITFIILAKTGELSKLFSVQF